MKRLDMIDIIRTIAFLEVFTCHCFGGGGSLGVSLFLVLSGFLLAYNNYAKYVCEGRLSPIQSIRFALSKLWPLYPLHVIMMIATLLYSVYMDNIPSGATLAKRLFLSLTMIKAGSINGVAWYLSVCLFTYCCFPYIIAIIRRYKTRFVAIVVMSLVFLIQAIIGVLIECGKLDWSMYEVTYISPFYRLGDFVIGCNLGFLFLNKKESKHTNHWVYTFLEVIVLLFLCLMWYNSVYSAFVPYYGLYYSAMFEPVSCMAVYVFAVGKGKISDLLNCQVVHFLAKISPYGFLIHYLIVRILITVSLLSRSYVSWRGKWAIAVIAMICTLLLSYGYDEVVVKQLHRQK